MNEQYAALKILYVEDDPVNALVAEKLLGTTFEITIAENGPKALALASQVHFDHVLVDINLGNTEMDGKECMLKMKKLPGYHKVKFFAVTSYGLPEDKDDFIRIGFDGYYIKPIEKEQMISAIIHSSRSSPL